jgi:hypothetical protein
MPNSEPISLAAQKLKFQVVFSCLMVLGGLLATWFILGETSPFNNYFTRHDELQDVWRITVLIPYFVGALIAGNPHSPSMLIFILALIVQWCVLGFLLSSPMAKLWIRRQRK